MDYEGILTLADDPDAVRNAINAEREAAKTARHERDAVTQERDELRAELDRIRADGDGVSKDPDDLKGRAESAEAHLLKYEVLADAGADLTAARKLDGVSPDAIRAALAAGMRPEAARWVQGGTPEELAEDARVLRAALPNRTAAITPARPIDRAAHAVTEAARGDDVFAGVLARDNHDDDLGGA